MSSKAQMAARALILAGLAAAFTATTAEAQTPEGTTIWNKATLTFTDANSNTYAAVEDSVSVTVGFQAGISVTPDGGSQAPASPSTANSFTLTVENAGNGVDTVQVSEVVTDVDAVFDSIGYRWNLTDYQTLAALNTALATYELAMGATTTIDIVYNVATGKGGLTANYEMTATSVRDNTESDPGDFDVNVGETLAVTVTPDGGQNLTHLPSNGTNYTFTFTVQNTGDGPEDFDLRAYQQDVTDVTIVSVDGVAGDSTRISLNSGASSNIDVVYSVLDVAAGTQDTVFLRARSVTGPGTAEDTGFADLTVVRPALTITKQAWDAARSAQISGDVLPGETIWYRIEVTNTGTADASNVVVTDNLPAEVTYVTYDDPDSSWDGGISEAGGTVTATRTTLAQAASDLFWIQVTIN